MVSDTDTEKRYEERRRYFREEIQPRMTRTKNGFAFVPDLSRMPSGQCEWHIMGWIVAAFQELERLHKVEKDC